MGARLKKYTFESYCDACGRSIDYKNRIYKCDSEDNFLELLSYIIRYELFIKKYKKKDGVLTLERFPWIDIKDSSGELQKELKRDNIVFTEVIGYEQTNYISYMHICSYWAHPERNGDNISLDWRDNPIQLKIELLLYYSNGATRLLDVQAIVWFLKSHPKHPFWIKFPQGISRQDLETPKVVNKFNYYNLIKSQIFRKQFSISYERVTKNWFYLTNMKLWDGLTLQFLLDEPSASLLKEVFRWDIKEIYEKREGFHSYRINLLTNDSLLLRPGREIRKEEINKEKKFNVTFLDETVKIKFLDRYDLIPVTEEGIDEIELNYNGFFGDFVLKEIETSKGTIQYKHSGTQIRARDICGPFGRNAGVGYDDRHIRYKRYPNKSTLLKNLFITERRTLIEGKIFCLSRGHHSCISIFPDGKVACLYVLDNMIRTDMWIPI